MNLPSINASLNFISACLLVAGYILIRRKQIESHKRCMIAAFAVSSVFLTCYLYYHYHHGSVRFLGQGWIRPVYFSILISHVVLAVSVPVLALMVFYKAWKAKWEDHRKIARWTLPIWLYVSITGVVVYWMLYRIPGMR